MKKPKYQIDDRSQAMLDALWITADDAVGGMLSLDEIYNNVPESLKKVSVRIQEFHFINADEKTKEKVLKWLNRD